MIFGRNKERSSDDTNAIITPADLKSSLGQAALHDMMHPRPLPAGYRPYQPQPTSKDSEHDPKPDLTFAGQAGYTDNDDELLNLARGQQPNTEPTE